MGLTEQTDGQEMDGATFVKARTGNEFVQPALHLWADPSDVIESA